MRNEIGRLMLDGSLRAPVHEKSAKPDEASSSLPVPPPFQQTPAAQTEIETQANGPHSGAAPLSGFAPTFVRLVTQIREDLEGNLSRLLQLNPSRREAVAQHLDRLAGQISGPSTAAGHADAAGGLRRWVDSPKSPSQILALQTYFEEIARITLGQTLLLKAWSDRGLRNWKQDDLGRMNWILSQALKPHVPIDREGWQITRPNLYSWYNPPASIQQSIWKSFENWRVRDEGPSLLASLLRLNTQAQPGLSEMHGYDERFFTSLWEHMHQFGFQPETAKEDPLKRKRVVFSPSLRDGSMVRTGPGCVIWAGLEQHPYLLLVAELVQLWWGPAAPPLWSQGSGLEAHSRDQLSLDLGSPKPSLLSRISEMEACDLSFVIEERTVRGNTRSAEATRFREQLDTLPYFKKLRSQGTSLGDLQACMSLTKLRPGGLLWWSREEPLSAIDGEEMLGFALERAKLVCEWDFSQISHSLPGSRPSFPKYLYLFQREYNLEQRASNRPMRISLHGQVRSHVEVPLLLADALRSLHQRSTSSKGQWQIHLHQSPTPQKEWAERWPDPTEHDTVRAIEELRAHSSPLASVSTIRATPHGDAQRDHAWSVPTQLCGFWVQSEARSGKRKLVTARLPEPGKEAHGSGFIIILPDEGWIAPMAAYLESPVVHDWLEHHGERRGERWLLTEQIVKFIPVPNLLVEALGGKSKETFARPLPGEWEKLASDIAYHPAAVKARLSDLAIDEAGKRIRATLFVRAARALEQLESSQRRLFSLVSSEGGIRWRDLLGILPPQEMTALTTHPQIRLSGSMPSHLPIGRMERVKSPSPGILLSTESGFHLHIGSEIPRLLDMIWEQLDGIDHPTWNELANYLRLPRALEFADAMAGDVLRSHGEQSAKRKALVDLLTDCLVF